jgi:polyisoprenoid-binding protein YceI
MKKITLLAVAALAMTFASCKKDYTCECKVTSTASGTNVTSTTSGATGKMKKADAEAKCNEGDSNTSILGITVTSECSIK